eukprot:403350437
MLINNFAKYSGKGTPMISRRGKSTICLYACFKHGLTEHEMEATGMKPLLDQELIDNIKTKDKYANAQSRVFQQFGNANNSTGFGGGNGSQLSEIRERIKGGNPQYGNPSQGLQSGYTKENMGEKPNKNGQKNANAKSADKRNTIDNDQHLDQSNLEDPSLMNGYDFLRELCINLFHEKKKGNIEKQRPQSSAFRGISRDKLLIYNIKQVGPHCGRYKPSYSQIEQRVRVANFNLNQAENPYENPFPTETEQISTVMRPLSVCEKFKHKQEKIIQQQQEKEQLNKKTSEMQTIIDKILKKNSPAATLKDKKKLIQSLESIPLNKRKEVILFLTKQLHTHQSGLRNYYNQEIDPSQNAYQSSQQSPQKHQNRLLSQYQSDFTGSKRNSIFGNDSQRIINLAQDSQYSMNNNSPLKTLNQSRINAINKSGYEPISIYDNTPLDQTQNSIQKQPLISKQSTSMIIGNASISANIVNNKRPSTSVGINGQGTNHTANSQGKWMMKEEDFNDPNTLLKRLKSQKFSAFSQAPKKQSFVNSGLTRESFFDFIQGPNEKRFIPFNNMPQVCSKFKATETHEFDKYVSREQGGIRSDRTGSCGVSAVKNMNLQDYDYNFMVNKPNISKGSIKFEKQLERPTLTIKKSYEGAANQFQHLYNTDVQSMNKVGHFKQAKQSAAWDKQLPRDNAAYNLSETMNLREDEWVKKENFKRDQQFKRQQRERSKSSMGYRSTLNQYESQNGNISQEHDLIQEQANNSNLYHSFQANNTNSTHKRREDNGNNSFVQRKMSSSIQQQQQQQIQERRSSQVNGSNLLKKSTFGRQKLQ